MARLAAPDSDPVTQRLVEEARGRERVQLRGRERTVEYLSAAAFLAAALAFAVFVPGGRALDPALAAALVVLYAIAARVKFQVGSGWTTATQLVFVPMLFLLPISSVPLFVVAALLLFRAPEYLRGDVHPERSVLQLGHSFHAFGPVAVLALAGVSDPSWSNWPIYGVALLAQFALDLGLSTVREHLGYGLDMRTLLREEAPICLVDSLLSPIGLLVAFAAVDQPWACILVLPLLGLLGIFSREREGRIENALALGRAYRGTAYLLGEVLATSDAYTGKHSRSVVVLAHQVGEQLGLDESVLREIEFGALLHDVGKIAIPNELVNKPGALEVEEWALMKTHADEGARMIERIGGVLEEVGQIVRHHHEHWDGSGYPDGLRGEQIPLAARVIAVCDAFHAMTSDRSYRSAMSRAAAIDELERNSGSQFDPRVVEALVAVATAWEPAAEPVEARSPEAIGL